MPRSDKFCCDPFKPHKKPQRQDLRLVSAAAIAKYPSFHFQPSNTYNSNRNRNISHMHCEALIEALVEQIYLHMPRFHLYQVATSILTEQWTSIFSSMRNTLWRAIAVELRSTRPLLQARSLPPPCQTHGPNRLERSFQPKIKLILNSHYSLPSTAMTDQCLSHQSHCLPWCLSHCSTQLPSTAPLSNWTSWRGQTMRTSDQSSKKLAPLNRSNARPVPVCMSFGQNQTGT